MSETTLVKRLRNLGIDTYLKSYDTLVGISSLIFLFYYFPEGIPESTGSQLLISFGTISASLFAIVLTGLTIITAFTDRIFLYAWKEIGEWENIVTVFQYNLILPVIVVTAAILLQIQYNAVGVVVLVSIFLYMIVSLLDLVHVIIRYALQRGEFVEKEMEMLLKNRQGETERADSLSADELKTIKEHLSELNEIEDND